MNIKLILRRLSILILMANSLAYGAETSTIDLIETSPTTSIHQTFYKNLSLILIQSSISQKKTIPNFNDTIPQFFSASLPIVEKKISEIDTVVQDSYDGYTNVQFKNGKNYHAPSYKSIIERLENRPSEFTISENVDLRVLIELCMIPLLCYQMPKATDADTSLITSYNYLLKGFAGATVAYCIQDLIANFVNKPRTIFSKDGFTYYNNSIFRTINFVKKPQEILWKNVKTITLKKFIFIDCDTNKITNKMYVELYDKNEQLLCNSNDILLSHSNHKNALLFLNLVTRYKAEHDNCSPESIEIQLSTKVIYE
ncbi:hypothetical protein JKY79_02700 [Candidatus Babeliales bacterium]|nr:hypothetical protein [Candidatus Babeliales bacterium]